MKRTTVHEAKTHLSRLLREVESGDEVIILRGRTPVAKLVRLPTDPPRRRIGTWKGRITTSGDFDAPLDDFVPYST